MIGTLLTLLVIVALIYLAFWIVDKVGLPNPLNWIAKGIVAIVALMIIVQEFNITF
jgi:hypothetical protein